MYAMRYGLTATTLRADRYFCNRQRSRFLKRMVMASYNATCLDNEQEESLPSNKSQSTEKRFKAALNTSLKPKIHVSVLKQFRSFARANSFSE